MPLLTAILEPDRFNSAVLAGYVLDYLRDRPRWPGQAGRGTEGELVVMTDAIEFALDRMKAEGVIA